MPKIDIAFDVDSWHVAMTFAGFECLESPKSLFPPSIKFAPNKSYLIELCSTPVIVVILIITLNGDPLPEPIAVLPVVTALIPSLFRGQPFALSKHVDLVDLYDYACRAPKRRSRNELLMTVTDESAIAAAAKIGAVSRSQGMAGEAMASGISTLL